MSLDVWLAFFVASWLISLSPGSGAISCMAAGLRYGYRRALWNILGLQLGILLVLAIVAVGPGRDHRRVDDAVRRDQVARRRVPRLARHPAVARAGVADRPTAPAARRDGGTPRKLVLTGFLVNATNPKGIVFMLAVLPQFIDPAKPQFVQYAICGATLFFTDLVVMSGYTGFAAKVLRLLREPHHVRWMNRDLRRPVRRRRRGARDVPANRVSPRGLASGDSGSASARRSTWAVRVEERRARPTQPPRVQADDSGSRCTPRWHR